MSRFPGFGDFSRSLNNFVGKPPRSVFVVEGSTVNISCLVTSYDLSQTSSKPSLLVNDIDFSKLCTSRRYKPTNNVALCEIKDRMSFTTSIVKAREPGQVIYTHRGNYVIKNVIYNSKINHTKYAGVTSKQNFNHIATFEVKGTYGSSDRVSLQYTIVHVYSIIRYGNYCTQTMLLVRTHVLFLILFDTAILCNNGNTSS